jgi:hypothetical protein
MSPLLLSACLLSSLTKPLSPQEIRARPEPGSLAFGLYAVRAAFSVREGMTVEEAEAILGKPDCFRVGGVSVALYSDMGLRVLFRSKVIGVAGERDREELRVERVEFLALLHLDPLPRPKPG